MLSLNGRIHASFSNIQYLKAYIMSHNHLITIVKTFTGIDLVTSIIVLSAINALSILKRKKCTYMQFLQRTSIRIEILSVSYLKDVNLIEGEF